MFVFSVFFFPAFLEALLCFLACYYPHLYDCRVLAEGSSPSCSCARTIRTKRGLITCTNTGPMCYLWSKLPLVPFRIYVLNEGFTIFWRKFRQWQLQLVLLEAGLDWRFCSFLSGPQLIQNVVTRISSDFKFIIDLKIY